MGEPKSWETRVAEKEAQLQRALRKAEQYKEQLKQLQTRKANEERKQRTHRLIVAGAELAALYGRVLDQDEVLAVVDFLRQQKDNGLFTLEKTETAVTEKAKEPELEAKTENAELYGGLFDF
jgi:hypothetical protein